MLVLEMVTGGVSKERPMYIMRQSQVHKTAIVYLLAQLVGEKV